jgi:hypothetical protein
MLSRAAIIRRDGPVARPGIALSDLGFRQNHFQSFTAAQPSPFRASRTGHWASTGGVTDGIRLEIQEPGCRSNIRKSTFARRRSITANWNLTRDRRNADMRAKARISCRPSFLAPLAFPRDALVRLVGMLHPVLELAVFFGKPLCHEI